MVKISVIENLAYFPFLNKIVLYVIQFIVLKVILTASSNKTQNVHFQELKVTRLLLEGEICTQP